MTVRGELHCCHCGYVAASVELPQTPGSNIVRFIPAANGPGMRRSAGQPPRCGRCNGPLFLEEVETVFPPVTGSEPLEPARPGRPRKVMGVW